MTEIPHGHECDKCEPMPEGLITQLSDKERQRLVDAMYNHKHGEDGEQGWLGRPECEMFADVLTNAVLTIKINAFHSGMRWMGRAHEVTLERDAALAEAERYRALLMKERQKTQ